MWSAFAGSVEAGASGAPAPEGVEDAVLGAAWLIAAGTHGDRTSERRAGPALRSGAALPVRTGRAAERPPATPCSTTSGRSRRPGASPRPGSSASRLARRSTRRSRPRCWRRSGRAAAGSDQGRRLGAQRGPRRPRARGRPLRPRDQRDVAPDERPRSAPDVARRDRALRPGRGMRARPKTDPAPLRTRPRRRPAPRRACRPTPRRGSSACRQRPSRWWGVQNSNGLELTESRLSDAARHPSRPPSCSRQGDAS